MSTNIQHGLCLEGINTIADLSAFWAKARQHLLPVLRKEYKELLYVVELKDKTKGGDSE